MLGPARPPQLLHVGKKTTLPAAPAAAPQTALLGSPSSSHTAQGNSTVVNPFPLALAAAPRSSPTGRAEQDQDRVRSQPRSSRPRERPLPAAPHRPAPPCASPHPAPSRPAWPRAQAPPPPHRPRRLRRETRPAPRRRRVSRRAASLEAAGRSGPVTRVSEGRPRAPGWPGPASPAGALRPPPPLPSNGRPARAPAAVPVLAAGKRPLREMARPRLPGILAAPPGGL